MTTIGMKTWLSPGVSRQREARVNDGTTDRFKLDAKRLAKAEALLAEGERMLTRQVALLAELHAGGLVTTEAERSVTRLKATLLARRSAHSRLVAHAKTDA